MATTSGMTSPSRRENQRNRNSRGACERTGDQGRSGHMGLEAVTQSEQDAEEAGGQSAQQEHRPRRVPVHGPHLDGGQQGMHNKVTQVQVPAKKSGDSIASTAEPQSTLGIVFLIILAARPSVWTVAVATQH